MSASWSDPDGEKYIYRFGKGPEELYDLSEDPAERENLRDDARARERGDRLYSETAQWFSSMVSRYDETAEDGGGERQG